MYAQTKADQVVLVVFGEGPFLELCITRGYAWIPGFATVANGIILAEPSKPTGTTDPTGLGIPGHRWA